MALGIGCDRFGHDGLDTFPEAKWDPVWRTRRDTLPLLYKEIQFHHRPANYPSDPKAELDELATLKGTERPGAMPEIEAQQDQFIDAFYQLLGLSRPKLPQTDTLLSGVIIISEWWILKFKAEFKRARPVQLRRDLDPPFCPGHAAYPSGHAGQSRAVALALAKALPAEWKGPLMKTSHRIGRLREIAGVHYPSDSEAGRALARDLVAALEFQSQYFRDSVDAARKELELALGGRHPPP